MTAPTKIILLVWGVIGCLVVALILFTLPSRQASEGHDLQSALVGKWTGDAGETDEFLPDGSVTVGMGDKSGKYRFAVLDQHRFQISPEKGAFSRDVIFSDVTIKDDRMTVKSPFTGGEATYRRVQAAAASATPPAKESAKPSAAATAQAQASQSAQLPKKSENLKADIVGKWQAPGKSETNEWSADGTVVMKAPGHDLHLQYIVKGNDRILIFPEGESPTTGAVWCAEVYGDVLYVTTPMEKGPATDAFVRVKADGSVAPLVMLPHAKMDDSVAGTWASASSGGSLVLQPDGTFTFGDNSGIWNIVADELIATDRKNGITWKMYLLPDGHTLSGHFGNYSARLHVAGAVTLAR